MYGSIRHARALPCRAQPTPQASRRNSVRVACRWGTGFAIPRRASGPAPSSCSSRGAGGHRAGGRSCRGTVILRALARESDALPPLTKDLPTDGENLFQAKDWQACFETQDEEFEYAIEEVEGELPSDLRGTLYRICPGSVEMGDHKYKHWLDGDGYVMSFVFEGGGELPAFTSKYVDTLERREELQAQKVLYRTTFGTQPDGFNAGNIQLKNPANTNVVKWGGKLLGLWEAGCPYELDPVTLETIGKSDLNGWLNLGKVPTSSGIKAIDRVLGFGDAYTAHPHVVHSADGGASLVSWKWTSVTGLNGRTDLKIQIREVDEDWRTISQRGDTIVDSPMAPHDFAVTDSSYVMTIPPMNLSILPFLAGISGPAECVSLRKSPMRVLVMPRQDPDQVMMTSETEAVYYIHYANAFDDDEEIVLRGSAWGPEAVRALADSPRGGILGSWDDVMEGNFTAPVTSFWEHRIHRTTGKVSRRLLSKQNMDHPRVNPNMYGQPNRFAYFNNCVCPPPYEESGPPQAWTRLDIETGAAQQVYFGPRCFTEELIFVTRDGSQDQEDCGYLVGMMYSAERDRSALVVLDASDFSKGPLCKLWLKDRVPHGLHGYFSSEIA